MKLVKAYFKAFKLRDVTIALHHINGLSGASISKIAGFGRGRDATSTGFSPGDSPSQFDTHIKLEVVCSDDLVEKVITAVHRAAHTGLRGDGKIYVSNVEQKIRIQDDPAF